MGQRAYYADLLDAVLGPIWKGATLESESLSRPSAAAALSALVRDADLDEAECERFEIKVRENGEVVWRGRPVDGSDAIGGIVTVR